MNQIQLKNQLDKLNKIKITSFSIDGSYISYVFSTDNFDFYLDLDIKSDCGKYSLLWSGNYFSDFAEIIEGHSLDLKLDEEDRFGYAYTYHNLENYYEDVIDKYNNKRKDIACNSIEETIKTFNNKLYGYIKNGLISKEYISDLTAINKILYSILNNLKKDEYKYDANAIEQNSDDIVDCIKEVLVMPKYNLSIKEECNITRTDEEIKNILKSILARGVDNASDKQKKYITFCVKIKENE